MSDTNRNIIEKARETTIEDKEKFLNSGYFFLMDEQDRTDLICEGLLGMHIPTETGIVVAKGMWALEQYEALVNKLYEKYNTTEYHKQYEDKLYDIKMKEYRKGEPKHSKPTNITKKKKRRKR